jgi:hypothetical protein
VAINTFTTIKTSVADWLDRSDMSDAIDNMFTLVETRLYSELRIRDMESAFSDTIASGVVSLPTDFIEWKDLYINTDPVRALEFKSSDWIQRNYPQRTSTAAPVYAAMSNGTIIFGPFPDSGYTVNGVYYSRPTALSTSNESNFLTTTYPDVLQYGVLVETAGYIGQDERFPMWQSRYNEGLNRLMLAERKERYPSAVAIRTVAA